MRTKRGRYEEKRLEGKTVLVVEDDQETLFMISRVLAAGGCDVLWARSAEDAMDLLGRRHRSVDVLLMDVVLPGTSGPLLAEQALRIYPHLSTVYLSAYDPETVRSHGVDPERVPFLPKPYEPAELLRVVAEALEQADGEEEAR